MKLLLVSKSARRFVLKRYVTCFLLVVSIVLGVAIAQPMWAQDAVADSGDSGWQLAQLASPSADQSADQSADSPSDNSGNSSDNSFGNFSDPTVAVGNSTAPVLGDPEPGNDIDGYPVILGDEVLFRVKGGVEGVATAEERANIIAGRINAIADDKTISPDQIQVDTQNNRTVIKAGDRVLFTVTETDAQIYGRPIEQLAEQAAGYIRTAIATYREERSTKQRALGIVFAIVSTLVLIILLRSLFLFSSKLLLQIARSRRAGTLGVRFRGFHILEANATGYLLGVLIRLGRLVLILAAFYLYIPFILRQFPATRPLGDRVLGHLASQLNDFAQAFVAYLPNLFTIIMIGVVAYYLFGFIKQVIVELGRPDVYPWFYAEWIEPTKRLAGFLVFAIACVFAGPYLPGFGSPAFQGVSIFIGALLTLGSSSAVANAVSGIILSYTRSFQIGDFIRIDTNMGQVTEKSLFVTRIMTPRRETITIPNLAVLNSNVVNYTAICRESGGYLVLYTTVTLGYDIPWRKIHEVMIDAAKATKYIVADPAPFVLQTALNDYNVSYQINAYTNRPELMPRIYSELHSNLQDYCNSADIEILSPAFSSLRDGNHSTIPANYLPDDYRAPAFQIRQD